MNHCGSAGAAMKSTIASVSVTPSSLKVTGSGSGSCTNGMWTVTRGTHARRSASVSVACGGVSVMYSVLVDRNLISLKLRHSHLKVPSDSFVTNGKLVRGPSCPITTFSAPVDTKYPPHSLASSTRLSGSDRLVQNSENFMHGIRSNGLSRKITLCCTLPVLRCRIRYLAVISIRKL